MLLLLMALLGLYIPNLGRSGLLGPDEPRYASIGRAMAHTHDFVTPKLDGQPWFEKPPLTYWLTALGHSIGLTDEWAARLPQALLSVAFLLFFFAVVWREFSWTTALSATLILATSAGWLAYSFAALTDLPMAVALNTAVLLTLEQKRDWRSWLIGICLGMAILAKGFVPVVLYAPVLLFGRWGRPGANHNRATVTLVVFAVGAPWFVLNLMRNGSAFWNDFFWKQHVERFFSPTIEHVQPFWFYFPVLLGGLFPWTPLAGLLFRSQTYRDLRIVSLAMWVLYGFVFFSLSRNKLPGYLLPLMPALAIVLAQGLEAHSVDRLGRRRHWLMGGWLAACAGLLILLPAAADLLPDALLSGLSRTSFKFASSGLIFLAAGLLALWLTRNGLFSAAVVCVALAAAGGVLYLKYSTLPALDRLVSVRAFWKGTGGTGICIDNVKRSWEYGLNYYAGHALPTCTGADPLPSRIVVRDGRLSLGASE